MEFLAEVEFSGFLFSTDKTRLQLPVVHDYLSNRSYWAPKIPQHVVQKSIDNSLCIGIFKDGSQVGFARIVTDYATFGYLADVFILEPFRGRGLSKKMMEFIFTFDFIPGLRRFLLATQDAHGLYRQFGFGVINRPDRFMDINKPTIYG
jgi:GNAT superfamily N-acetyltransferase